MSPTYKSILCALVFAVIVGCLVSYFWQQTAGSFAGGVGFVVGLILFGRVFKVPARSTDGQE